VAHSLSAKKRIRQNAKQRARNRARKRVLKDDVKSFQEALSERNTEKASDALKVAIKHISQVASKGTIHKRTASRKISRLQKRYNTLATKH
jgi:small subunit ribosomal protein S20